MNGWRNRTMIAGVTVIVLTNAIALGGVAYNRSGVPESVLQLTQRELGPSYSAWSTKENSGMALSLHWRVLTRERSELDEPAVSFGPYGGPAWFDRDKLKEVGFDVTRLTDTDRGRNFYERHLPREALVVLELDGPAYQRSLAAVRAYGARQNALLAANPGRKEFEDRARRGKDLIEQEERDNSRLFVVDAGLDAAALRAKYPDTSRYAILHGRVRPSISWDSKKPELTGVVSELDVQEINVPARFRKHFAAAQRQYALPSASPFAATLAIGRRLEPWITALSPRAGEHGADVPDLRP